MEVSMEGVVCIFVGMLYGWLKHDWREGLFVYLTLQVIRPRRT